MAVISPKQSWKVVSNGAERVNAVDCKTELGANLVRATGFREMLDFSGWDESGYLWDFAPSVKQSSYIYAMCAGEFE